jgi:hypothetical protein
MSAGLTRVGDGGTIRSELRRRDNCGSSEQCRRLEDRKLASPTTHAAFTVVAQILYCTSSPPMRNNTVIAITSAPRVRATQSLHVANPSCNQNPQTQQCGALRMGLGRPAGRKFACVTGNPGGCLQPRQGRASRQSLGRGTESPPLKLDNELITCGGPS